MYLWVRTVFFFFFLSAQLMKCLGKGEPSPEKLLCTSEATDPLNEHICGGEEGGRFPGNLCIDG